MTTRRITLNAVLTAIALTIFAVEMLVPLPLPVPGIKLGLSNIVTLFAMFALGPVDALAILIIRIFIGALFSGNVFSLLYSVAGGALCYLATLLLKKAVNVNQIWVCGAVGAVFHNIGQIAVAALVIRSLSIAAYLPVLIIAGIITGSATGILAQLLVIKLKPFISALLPKKKEDNSQKK